MTADLEVYAPGTRCLLQPVGYEGQQHDKLLPEGMLGVITAAVIRRDEVLYEVAYYARGRRRTATVTEDELRLHVDRKSVRVARRKQLKPQAKS